MGILGKLLHVIVHVEDKGEGELVMNFASDHPDVIKIESVDNAGQHCWELIELLSEVGLDDLTSLGMLVPIELSRLEIPLHR